MIIVAVAAIIAWRTDKTRFEAVLADYGEEDHESPFWDQIESGGVADAFSIRHITFVVLDSAVCETQLKEQDLSKLFHPAEADKIGRPSPEISSLIDQLLHGVHHNLSLVDATAVNYLDDGYFWKVTWSLYPSQGSGSGIPFQYRGFVRADGTVVRPAIFLRDYFGSFYSGKNDVLFSVMPIDGLLPVSKSPPSDDEIVDSAETSLSDAITRLELPQKFRFENLKHMKFSGNLNSQRDLDSDQEVWSVEFVDKSVPKTVKNGNSALRITVWVTSDLKTSDLSVSSWSIE